ncbi:kinase-like protein [Gigaspora margarita]|uniref:Kinase-like protein n=1 Tax=Gigaspora margarita TaxID=4874 RepID=A0A8H4AJ26_GIGMA|nr:kinase-like protein [Gigaspora margarita]
MNRLRNRKFSKPNAKWLHQVSKDSSITSFEYSSFKNIEEIGRGGIGIVYTANHKEKTVVLKSLFYSETIKELVNELHVIDSDPNVIRFYGITTDPKTDNLIAVLLFADGGNLQQHLQNKWLNGTFKISLDEVINIARQVTLGLKCLHTNNIIHRDLHPRNILVNGDKFLITDFGLSRKLNNSMAIPASASNGTPAYIDPQYHINPKKMPDESSDIYSLGVIFWELTSGTSSFGNAENRYIICIQILQGYREEVIPNTPSDYAELYKCCWDSDPQKRPSLDEILEVLDEISSKTTPEFITNSNRKPKPFLAKDNSHDLLVGPSAKIIEEPNSKCAKVSCTKSLFGSQSRSFQKSVESSELKAQGIVYCVAKYYDG